MENQIKFTDEEVQQINQLRQDATNLFLQLGQLTVERKRRLEELDKLESELLQNQKELVQVEENLFKSLNEKYGDGNYDPVTGVFTPINNEVTQ